MALETIYKPGTMDDRGAYATPYGAGPSSASAHGSAVSWSAVFAGAVAAAALSLILLILGTGLGLTSISPWSHNGVTASTFGISTIVWITVTQLLASGMGGYIAGRLRTKWVGVHTDEVYFRDTAHGFLAWAVASMAAAVMLTSAVGSLAAGAGAAGAAVASAAAQTVGGAAGAMGGTAAMQSGSSGSDASQGSTPMSQGGAMSGPRGNGYFIDSLFRKPAPAAGSTDSTNAAAGNGAQPNSAADTSASTAEVTRIFVNGMSAQSLPPADVTYVGQVIAQRTGISQQDAEKRVTDTFAAMQAKVRDAEAAAKDAADKARKATAYATLWLFVSLLAGAFIASLSATWGGRERDSSILAQQPA